MKVIIYRDKKDGDILHSDNAYEELIKRGDSDEDIAQKVKNYNESSNRYAEIVELDEYAEYYRNRSNNAYKDALDDMRRLADDLDDLACDVRAYIRRAEEEKL